MLTTESLNVTATRIRELNKLWWVHPKTQEPLNRNLGELSMLVVSELAEAMEGHRKNLMDDHLPHRKMIEVELADAKIRIFDTAGHYKWWLVDVVQDVPPLNKRFNVGQELLAIVRVACQLDADNPKDLPRVLGDRASHLLAFIDRLGTALKLDVDTAMEEKLIYNKSRRDHTLEARLEPGGKAY